MKSKHLIAIILVAAIIHLCTTPAAAQNVSLNITGIQSAKGQIVISVFTDEKSFKDTKPAKKLTFPKTALANGVLSVSMALEPGTYGIAVLDDVDSNGEMKKNMLGIPKEGFGFSNFYLSGMSRPSFTDFEFDVKTAILVKLESKLRYM